MTAEPVKVAHQWPLPPQDGYTVDDLFTLPELPPHTELIDGSLVFVSPQRRFHAKMINLLLNGLERTVPAEMTIEREITVVLDRRNGPEPDISVARSSGIVDMDQTHFLAADILLAIEVISPESEARDRSAKPAKYAAAGIPNFWLVERAGADKHPVVHVYELDRLTKAYALTGIHHDRLKTGVPFTIDIDISRGALGR
ncbi:MULTISPECIES: Uma2 family endonuclease [unclassified Streptomyces]|uniref:Uma2 family endonuclease n=1 Tax=unclassified Streptomyces TaxID=2593676 RepID=UPI00136ACCC6|nr:MULTISPECIES: Uma2 family endonuclease [unclassified Streptomyces]MYV57422.1 Uma2 family endonuclease [Streptomyces sp. SID3212]WSJ45425.1 Uma2 family endonuclease [Streptomyces sp. NBC_01317]